MCAIQAFIFLVMVSLSRVPNASPMPIVRGRGRATDTKRLLLPLLHYHLLQIAPIHCQRRANATTGNGANPLSSSMSLQPPMLMQRQSQCHLNFQYRQPAHHQCHYRRPTDSVLEELPYDEHLDFLAISSYSQSCFLIVCFCFL